MHITTLFQILTLPWIVWIGIFVGVLSVCQFLTINSIVDLSISVWPDT